MDGGVLATKHPSITFAHTNYNNNRSGSKEQWIIKDNTLLQISILNKKGVFSSRITRIIKKEGPRSFKSWAKSNHLMSISLDSYIGELATYANKISNDGARKVFKSFFTDYFSFNCFDEAEREKHLIFPLSFLDSSQRMRCELAPNLNTAVSKIVGYKVPKILTDNFASCPHVGVEFLTMLGTNSDLRKTDIDKIVNSTFIETVPFSMGWGNARRVTWALKRDKSLNYKRCLNLLLDGFSSETNYALMYNVLSSAHACETVFVDADTLSVAATNLRHQYNNDTFHVYNGLECSEHFVYNSLSELPDEVWNTAVSNPGFRIDRINPEGFPLCCYKNGDGGYIIGFSYKTAYSEEIRHKEMIRIYNDYLYSPPW